MTEFDYVVYEIKVAKEGVFDLKEVYKIIKEFFTQKDYYLIEKEQSFSDNGTLKVKWEGSRKVDDYTEFVIEVTISGSGVKEVKLKNKDSFSGNFSIKFESNMKKDYEEKWENSPIPKFFRGLYDKFIIGSKFDRYSKDLKEETYALYNEVKSYIGVNKV